MRGQAALAPLLGMRLLLAPKLLLLALRLLLPPGLASQVAALGLTQMMITLGLTQQGQISLASVSMLTSQLCLKDHQKILVSPPGGNAQQ